jgi:hypothetical protein
MATPCHTPMIFAFALLAFPFASEFAPNANTCPDWLLFSRLTFAFQFPSLQVRFECEARTKVASAILDLFVTLLFGFGLQLQQQ